MNKLKLKDILRGRVVTLIIINFLIITIMSLIRPDAFFDPTNFSAILIGMTFDLLLACGMTVVLMLGCVDLSVGAVVAFTAVVSTLMMTHGIPIIISIIIGMLIATIIGMINGLLVSFGKLAPFVATLGTQTIFRGTCYVVTKGYVVAGLPINFLVLGQGKVFGISNLIIFSVGAAIIMAILIPRLTFFRQVYLVGSSRQVAFMSGISSNKVITLGYTISGFFAGFAGVLMASRYAYGSSGFYVGAESRAIAAAVIGGAVMSGGEGNMLGTVMGVLLVALVNNVFIMFGGNAEWQTAISGIMLVAALFIDVLRTKRAESKGLI